MKNEVCVTDMQSERTLFKGYKGLCRKAVDCVTKHLGYTGKTEVDISFIDRAEIRRLNREYRGKDKETDVLSFPLNSDVQNIDPSEIINGRISLGDVLICPDYIYHQAKEVGNTFKAEISYMVIHSVLHLFGYDHIKKKDAGVMMPLQEEIFRDFSAENDL